uniref:Methyltransferase domain-containing protein n=1 Tax=viral metagenome TaxID=1070528 RepID=A0A6C0H7C2_9ZZZZ
MKINQIIETVNSYSKDTFQNNFLNKIIKYLKNYKYKQINKIKDNKYLLSAIKIHLLTTKYYFYISNIFFIEFMTYKLLNLNDTQLNNLNYQINALSNQDNIFNLCDKLEINKINYKYFYILNDKLSHKQELVEIPIEIAFVLLGIESFKFLNHQNLNNYCSKLVFNKSQHIYLDLIKLKNELSIFEKEHIILFSGLINQFLGTLYTKDIDLLIIYKNNNDKNKFENIFQKYNNVDITYIHYKNNLDNWFIKKLKLYKLDIIKILFNPKYHFYFMGFKCLNISISTIISKCDRPNAVNINDIILLKKINNLDYYNKMCIKNITINNNLPRVMTDEWINKMYHNIIKIMKEWWNMDIDINYLKLHFGRCIYYNYIKPIDKYIIEILYFIKILIYKVLHKYCYNKESIYDISSGSFMSILSYIKIYNKLNIKTIYVIESSKHNIKIINKRIIKYGGNYNIIHDSINNNLNFTYKSDCILLLFSIQYINDLNLLINNIKQLCHKDTIIIIALINKPIISKNVSFEIKYNNEIYFGVYSFDNNKILFYMKDLYGYNTGSIENIINSNSIINIFQNNNFILLEKISFSDKINYHKFNFHNFQKQILSYCELLIFKNL